MAEFSKEWCFENDRDRSHDFSIQEEFNKLKEGDYIPIICEGVGFWAISKQDGKCKLAYGYSEVINWQIYEF